MAVGGRKHDVAALLRDRLAGVLHQVQEHLHQLVKVTVHRRQRWIVTLDELHAFGKPVLGQAAHAFVQRAIVQRAQVVDEGGVQPFW